MQHYRDAVGTGLQPRNPFDFIKTESRGQDEPSQRFELPLKLSDDSGTRWEEQMCLGAVTRLLKPKAIFEIGTYNGRTTAIFALNSEPHVEICSLDLPADAMPDNLFTSDQDLVKRRRTGYILDELGLEKRYRQVLCDSIQFDPTPYAGKIELGFIDGGHSLAHVRNDTEKMAVMAGDRGIVFWHDYGGLGEFLPLTNYLEALSKIIPIYRVPDMSLAWASMRDVARLRGAR